MNYLDKYEFKNIMNVIGNDIITLEFIVTKDNKLYNDILSNTWVFDISSNKDNSINLCVYFGENNKYNVYILSKDIINIDFEYISLFTNISLYSKIIGISNLNIENNYKRIR